jgi:hypothetical protein
MVIDTDAKLLKLIITYSDKTKLPLAAMQEKSERALPCQGAA